MLPELTLFIERNDYINSQFVSKYTFFILLGDDGTKCTIPEGAKKHLQGFKRDVWRDLAVQFRWLTLASDLGT